MSNDSSNYEFNAPHYVDFKNSNLDENDGADKFFDLQVKLENLKVDPDELENTSVEPSVLKSLENHIKEEKVSPLIQKDQHRALKEVSSNIMTTENASLKKKRSASRSPCQRPQKFISMAESVLLFSKKTPLRWHSKPRNQVFCKPQPVTKPKLTLPQSPALISVNRVRKVDYPTQEEKEEMEYQEIKNFQIKANPLKENVLHPSKLGKRVESKPPTKMEPFNLTEFKKKEMPKEQLFKFSAQSIPKGLFEHLLGVPEKKSVELTVPNSPAITKSKIKPMVLEERGGKNYLVDGKSCHWGVPTSYWKPGTTTVKPFTFEERDKQIQRKKEEKVNQILKQEKEAREFHAQPLPKFIKKVAGENLSYSVEGSTLDFSRSPNCSSSSKDGSENQSTHFKARPATVLHKEPFVPKKTERPALSPEEILLHTEKRAEERKAFDAHIQEKEEELKRYWEMVQAQKEQEEMEEVARLRKTAVHKANPMPDFQSPQLSFSKKSPTVPISPKFSDRFKK